MSCLVAVSAACHSPTPAVRPRDSRVIVTSFNFPESRLVAEIYADALVDAGVPVRREIDLGPRELVQPALQQGLVDVVPEYLGTALASVAPNATLDVADAGAVRHELGLVLGRWGLSVLNPAPAQDQNAVVVTRATAGRRGLAKVSDLVPIAPGLVLGGPPECPTRPYCLVGLERRYGLRFDRFVPLVGETRIVRALADGVVDVAVMFTTDGSLASPDLVLLADDRHLQPAENIVPVVRASVLARYGSLVADALGAVSARLTTGALRFLNWRVSVGGKDVATEARGWLLRQGLIARPGVMAR